MKLRLQSNSIRLRITPTELHILATQGKVESFVQFGLAHDDRLAYSIETTPEDRGPRVEYGDRTVRVLLPEATVRDWASTEQVGIEGQQATANGAKLTILVEKDFRCLQPRTDENDADRFAHPGELAQR